MGHLGELDISQYVDRYLKHLSQEGGLGPRQARRLLYDYGPSRGLINDLVATGLRLDQGIEVSPEAVVITVGAQEAMLLALRVLCRSPDDLLGLVDPSYYGAIGAARVLDVGLVAIRDSEHGIDLDHLEAACRTARAEGKRIRVLYVAPDFANPSGTVMDVATRRQLLRVAERQDLLLLEDNAYGFTAGPMTELPTLKALDEGGRVIYIGTFAKICMPGARVGFVVADQIVRSPEGNRGLLADELALIKSMTTVNTSPLCQAMIGGMVLEHGGSIASLGRDQSRIYRRNLALLLEALDRHLSQAKGVAWNRPAGGFFVRMRIPVPADAALLELSASKYGVLWTPLSSFYLGRTGTHDLRLSCSYVEPDQIEVGVVRLARLLREITLPPERFTGNNSRCTALDSARRDNRFEAAVRSSRSYRSTLIRRTANSEIRMKYSRYCRSLLWTSASTPERYYRGHDGGADVCVVDLEDSVSSRNKEAARQQADSFFSCPSASLTRCGIRINSLSGSDGLRDLLAIQRYPVKPAIVVIPKVETGRDIEIVEEVLDPMCPETEFFAIVETPRGLENATEIATASHRLRALLFGAADYSFSIGARRSWEAMVYARSKLINSARARNVDVVDSPMFEISDITELKQECTMARELGFSGKAAIHPDHVPIINEAFSPDFETLETARRVVAAGQNHGLDVTVVDGAMVGKPFFTASQHLLEEFAPLELSQPPFSVHQEEQ
jgi:(S)-3,5-dihydroxyphenylglycine transaminase